MIDNRLKFNSHVDYACEKAAKAISALSRIMPNNFGPNSSKRRLLASVSSSILRYSGPAWITALQTQRNRAKLRTAAAAASQLQQQQAPIQQQPQGQPMRPQIHQQRIEDRHEQQHERSQQLLQQLENEKRELNQSQLQIQQEQQFLLHQEQQSRQQQDSHHLDQWRQQQQDNHQQQVQQLQQQRQELQHLLQQERSKRQHLENQMGRFQHEQYRCHQNFGNVCQGVNPAAGVNWPHDLQEPDQSHYIPAIDQLPHDLRNDFMRFLQTRNRPNSPRPSGQVSNSIRFAQPVHKWPFEYSGQPSIIQLGEFLNQVNTYADTEGIEEQTLLRSIKHLLKGRALQWYTRSYLYLTSWETFRSEIKQEFLPPNYSEIIKQDLYLRFQGPNESFTSFYRDLVAAFEIVEPAISESEKLFIVKSHLNLDYIPIAAASRASTVKDLVTVCKEFEVSRSYSFRNRSSTTPRTFWNKSDSSPFQRPLTNKMEHSNRPAFNRQSHNTAHINAMELNSEIEEDWDLQVIQEHEAIQQDIALRNETASNAVEEVNAVRAQSNPRERFPSNLQHPAKGEQRTEVSTSTIICWQCENPGHTYPNCPNPKRFIFCYSCGKKGCTTRNCEACISRWKQLDSTNVMPSSGNRRWENPQ
ncbi:uncharacterized protein LOC128740069 [Sabethes cyaneus]|uniref:uncharacterized protein LOC128740069 n=1 Tax=Sabethes cyaneus TaxID=53552 RepID=UPI00237E7F80|nr:uncharacterized protein LOC128740069 [Sabethes cyaneus]